MTLELYSSEYLRETIAQLRFLNEFIHHTIDDEEKEMTQQTIKALHGILQKMLEDPKTIKQKLVNSFDPVYRKDLERLLKTRESEKEWFTPEWYSQAQF